MVVRARRGRERVTAAKDKSEAIPLARHNDCMLTPATTGPLLMPTRSFIDTPCSIACSRVMCTMRIAMRTIRSAWSGTASGRPHTAM